MSRATDEIVKIITLQFQIYNEYWNNFWSSQNLLHKLYIKGEKGTNAQYPIWFKREESSCQHRVAALKHLVKVTIYGEEMKKRKLHKDGLRNKLKNYISPVKIVQLKNPLWMYY